MVSMFEQMVEKIAGYGLSKKYRHHLIEKDFAQHMQKLKESDNLNEVAIGIQGERLQSNAGIRPRSGSHESASVVSCPVALFSQLSRTDTSASSVTSLSSSSSRVDPYTYSTPLATASRCSCGATGLCGCPRRAENQFYTTEKSIGFMLGPNRGRGNEKLISRFRGHIWLGYVDKNEKIPIDDFTVTRSNAMIQFQEDNWRDHEEDMIGEGCYRFSKSAPKECRIDNAIEKLGQMIDVVGNFAGDQLIPGYSDITYAEVARIKHDRDFPKRERPPYKKEVSKDGRIVQFNFPVIPIPLEFDESQPREQYYSSSWSHNPTACDLNVVRSLVMGENIGYRSLPNPKPAAEQTMAQGRQVPVALRHENRQLRPNRGPRQRRLAFADQPRNRRQVEGRAKVVFCPPKVDNAVGRPNINNAIVPSNNIVAQAVNSRIMPPNNASALQDERHLRQNTTCIPLVISERATPKLISQLGTSQPSVSCTMSICENAAPLAARPAVQQQPSEQRCTDSGWETAAPITIRRQPSGLRNQIDSGWETTAPIAIRRQPSGLRNELSP